MSILKQEDEKKWLNAFLALGAFIVVVILVKFFHQLGEWFDLEAKIPQFQIVVQGLALVFAGAAFVVVKKRKDTSSYLSEVYAELLKVAWPEKDIVLKLTIGILVALVIVSAFLVGADYLFRFLLEFVY